MQNDSGRSRVLSSPRVLLNMTKNFIPPAKAMYVTRFGWIPDLETSAIIHPYKCNNARVSLLLSKRTEQFQSVKPSDDGWLSPTFRGGGGRKRSLNNNM